MTLDNKRHQVYSTMLVVVCLVCQEWEVCREWEHQQVPVPAQTQQLDPYPPPKHAEQEAQQVVEWEELEVVWVELVVCQTWTCYLPSTDRWLKT